MRFLIVISIIKTMQARHAHILEKTTFSKPQFFLSLKNLSFDLLECFSYSLHFLKSIGEFQWKNLFTTFMKKMNTKNGHNLKLIFHKLQFENTSRHIFCECEPIGIQKLLNLFSHHFLGAFQRKT